MYQQILRQEVPIQNILASLGPYFMNPFDVFFILACNGSYILYLEHLIVLLRCG